MQVCKPCHYALVEAVEPFKLHPMSMSCIYEVFEHLLRLWMNIWLHTHTVSITDTSPDLWVLAQIPPDASLKTIPLQYGWGCRTFQTASNLYVIHSYGVWAPSQVLDGPMASQSHHYHHRHFPRFAKVGWNPTWCKFANYATMVWAEALEPLKLHPMSMSYVYYRFEHLLRLWMGIWLHIHMVTSTDTSPEFWIVRVSQNPTLCKCANHATMLWLRL